MIPLGEAGGAALAAGLTGRRFAFESSPFLDNEGAPSATGQFIIAIKPGACGGGTDHLVRLFSEIASEDGVRLPGKPRHARWAAGGNRSNCGRSGLVQGLALGPLANTNRMGALKGRSDW
jgi:LDH2 family malate/lactate/ureidoglycolate dehydrogenase